MFKKQSWSCNTPYQKMLEIYNNKDLNKDNRLFNSEPTNYLLGRNNTNISVYNPVDVKAIRKHLKLSQTKFAEEFGININTLSIKK